MFELLLYAQMACEDADAIVLRIKKHEHLKPEYKLELVETIKDYTPECSHYWDAND
jgi:hypothetical protein